MSRRQFRRAINGSVKIAFITAEGQWILDEDVDRPLHETAFAGLGASLEYRYWTDSSTDWSSYDLVVLRSPWDYPERPTEFMAWLESVAHLGTLQNPAGLVRWNLDKNYLVQFAGTGIPVVWTATADDTATVGEAMEAAPANDVVIKPAISAGSRNTGWFAKNDPEALRLAERILAEGNQVLIQPFASSVAERGEVSIVTIDGTISHALRKGPLLERGGGLIGGEYHEVISHHEASGIESEIASLTLETTIDLARENKWLPEGVAPLYGRFDMVELDDGTTALLEAELFEPSLFLELAPDSALRFAEACIARAEAVRSGSGPGPGSALGQA